MKQLTGNKELFSDHCALRNSNIVKLQYHNVQNDRDVSELPQCSEAEQEGIAKPFSFETCTEIIYKAHSQ